MAIKKSELYSSLWKSCDELRGGMDASQYKDYILVLLFVKYVSDRYAGAKDEPIEIPKGGGFQDMVKLKGTPDIGDGINKIIAKLADANGLKGIIDVADFNDPEKLGSGKDMQDRLSNLISIFQNDALDFSKNRVEGDDILGDAYEYLMRHFATESGKSKGQFYTPAEVSRVIAKVIGIGNSRRQDQTLYDPTCGSGSLLLKAAAEAPRGITIYGQENDIATRALAVMNMWLHGNPDAEIWRDNTITSPYFKDRNGGLKTFDYVVANPPFSAKSWSNGIDPTHDEFGRFEGFGIPPKKNGDYAFLLHVVKSLKSTGKGAIVMPHGVLFRGGAEAEIRKNLIKRGYIKGIIGLPANLFYGTGIPACIIVLDKENAEERKGIFMIDASKGFYKDGAKNRLRERDIHKIVDVFTKQTDTPKFSRLVPLSEVSNEKNDYSLNITRYIDNQEPEDVQDIEAHLNGGIPIRDIDDLGVYWKVYPSIRSELFTRDKRPGFLMLKVDEPKVEETIFNHPEFKAYSKIIERVYLSWKKKNLPLLANMDTGSKPKDLISEISEDLLASFSNLDLTDKYDVYQLLMDYWAETMQDDCYIIADDGWKAEISKQRNARGRETGWDCELLPKSLVTDKFFPKERETLVALKTDLDGVTQQMEEMDEENRGDEDLFSEVRVESGKISKQELGKRIEEIGNDTEFVDESSALNAYQKLTESQAKLKKEVKEFEEKLDNGLLVKYKQLTEANIKSLVIEDKWLHSVHDLIADGGEEISQNLARRIRELARRYVTPLPKLTKRVRVLSDEVEGHLKAMRYKW